MTGPTDASPPHAPMVLIDEWEDGWVENTAWVEVTSDVTDAAAAIRWVESAFPNEDRPDGESYVAEGDKVWLAQEGEQQTDDGPSWVEAKEASDGARLFWVVKVTCPV